MPLGIRNAAGFLLGLWAAFHLLLPLVARGAEPARDPALAALEARMHDAVNAERRRKHRIPLERKPSLDAVARAHSADMAARGYVAHETPEGLNPVDRLERGGIDGFTLAAENVGITDSAHPHPAMLEAWLESHEHREALLGPAFNATGLGIARAPDGRLYYTQVFVSFPRE